MQEAISALAQAADTASPGSSEPDSQLSIPLVTPEVDAGGARLSEMLSTQPEQPVYAIDPAVAPADAAGGAHTLGEKILARLDAVGAQFRTNLERTHALLEATPGNMSLKDLLKLQMETAQISLEIELVGKGVSKCVQHVDQLTRLQ
jgi:type III secretion system YscI/HrpB-like protein